VDNNWTISFSPIFLRNVLAASGLSSDFRAKKACLIFPYKEEVTGSNPVTPIHRSHNPATGSGFFFAPTKNHVTRFHRQCDPFFAAE
jgi:hypothetical protein